MKWKLNIVLLFICSVSYGQKEKIITNEGNKEYQAGDFNKAEERYENALEMNEDFIEAAYNLGNSYQRQADNLAKQLESAATEEEKEQIKESFKVLNTKAADTYAKALENADDKSEKSRLSYNRGNALLRAGELENSIDSYKEALRNNPADEDARYNLAYAKQMLKKQQEQQKKNQENKEEEKKEEKKEEQQPDDKQDEQKNDQQQEQQPKPDQLSQEDAEKMLDALNKEEKELQEKLKKEQHKAQRVTIEKDW